jgi:hypothetical protein
MWKTAQCNSRSVRLVKADGYTGSYSRVTDFTRACRGQEGNAQHAFVPLSFEQGEAFQFD